MRGGGLLHQWLLGGCGLADWPGGMLDLEKLSRTCEVQGRWNFFLSSVPLKVIMRNTNPAQCGMERQLKFFLGAWGCCEPAERDSRDILRLFDIHETKLQDGSKSDSPTRALRLFPGH